MKTFVIKTIVTVNVEGEADLVRSEISQSIQDVIDSGELPRSLGFEVRDPVQLETPRTLQAASAARKIHCKGSDDKIEIDDDAILSEGEDGPWIQAWLFVSNEKMKEE